MIMERGLTHFDLRAMLACTDDEFMRKLDSPQPRFGGRQLWYVRRNPQKDGSLLSFLSSIEMVVLDDAIHVLCRKSVSIRVRINQFMYRWLCTNHKTYILCDSQTRIDHYIAQCF